MSWLTDPDEEWDTDGGRPSRFAAPPLAEPTPAPPPDRFPPASDSDFDDLDDDEPPRSRLKLVALIVGAWAVVSVVVLLVLLAVRGPRNSPSADTVTTPSAPASTAEAEALATPAGWALVTSDDQANCAAHAYGQVQAFLTKTPCRSVHRELLTLTHEGKSVVVADYVITFGTVAQASQFTVLVKSDGTGNISDLLREGAVVAGRPTRLPPTAAFTAAQDGQRVRVAEAAYLTGPTAGQDSALDVIAQQAIAGR